MASNNGFSKYPSERTFDIDFTSEMDGQHYSGTFTVKRPTMIAQTKIEAEKSKMLGGKYFDASNPGVGISPLGDSMAESLCFLRVCLIAYPDWWNDGDLYDPSLLMAIYEEARQIDPFRKPDDTGADGATGGARKDSDNKHNNANNDDTLKALVDEEI